MNPFGPWARAAACRRGRKRRSGTAAASGWGYSTCVVSSGATRLFTFRRISSPNLRCTFALRTGDVVEMFGECQETYQHAVKVEASEEAAGPRVGWSSSARSRRSARGRRESGPNMVVLGEVCEVARHNARKTSSRTRRIATPRRAPRHRRRA